MLAIYSRRAMDVDRQKKREEILYKDTVCCDLNMMIIISMHVGRCRYQRRHIVMMNLESKRQASRLDFHYSKYNAIRCRCILKTHTSTHVVYCTNCIVGRPTLRSVFLFFFSFLFIRALLSTSLHLPLMSLRMFVGNEIVTYVRFANMDGIGPDMESKT